MAPVKLPSYVIFQDGNGLNLRLHQQDVHAYLMFDSTDRDLMGSQEVIPAPDYDDVVMIQNLCNEKYWKREPISNWIWADKSDKPTAEDPDYKDYLFKVVEVDKKTVALQCLANDQYLKGFSHDGKENCLNARASDRSEDTKLLVTSALSNRKVSDVVYEMEKMTEPSKEEPETLGFKNARNDTSKTKDIPVDVPYIAESKYSWRTVTTFDTGLDLTVTAGIPNFKTKNSDVEKQSRVKNGEMNPEENACTFPYTFERVRPREQVMVEIKGSKATASVPFKYTLEDQRVDGLDLDKEKDKEGIFEGVQLLDIHPVPKTREPVICDSRGTAK